MELWRSLLREHRRRIGITQAELAGRVGLSGETIRGYESRSSKPSAGRLNDLIEALKIPNAVANEIRLSAGYAPLATVHTGPREQHRYYTASELDATVETVPWPEFVVNDPVEVLAANHAAQALWRLDFERERTVRTRAQMNLLAVASERDIGDRVRNWEEIVSILVSMFKANQPQPMSLDTPSPYFQEVVQEFLKGDPAFLARLLDVWTKAEPMEGKIRWTYPVVWDDPGVGTLRFLATVSLANEMESTFFNDWIPLDRETWTRLGRIKDNWRKHEPSARRSRRAAQTDRLG